MVGIRDTSRSIQFISHFSKDRATKKETVLSRFEALFERFSDIFAINCKKGAWDVSNIKKTINFEAAAYADY